MGSMGGSPACLRGATVFCFGKASLRASGLTWVKANPLPAPNMASAKEALRLLKRFDGCDVEGLFAKTSVELWGEAASCAGLASFADLCAIASELPSVLVGALSLLVAAASADTLLADTSLLKELKRALLKSAFFRKGCLSIVSKLGK